MHTRILKTYRKVSLYICPSKFIENKLLSADILYKGKTIHLPNFIENDEQKEKYSKEDYVLFFGRLSEEKGLKIFVEACKEIKNIKFKIAGTGPLEDICKNIPNISFEGFKTGEDLNKLIGKAMFVVYPSICYENCPLSILEAESLGTPVLTVNYGGAKELVEESITGELITEVNKEELKSYILKMYNNKAKLKEMSDNCIKKKMYTLEEYCNDLERIYQKYHMFN